MTTSDFNEKVALQSDFLKPYAKSLTKDFEEAQDLYQETIARALMNRDKYTVSTNIKAWLYTIMRNTFINSYRKNKRFSKASADVTDDMALCSMNTNAIASGWNNVRLQEAKLAITHLPDTYRQSFELYYMGYKYKDIAKILDEPLGTVKSRIHFARKILVSQLIR